MSLVSTCRFFVLVPLAATLGAAGAHAAAAPQLADNIVPIEVRQVTPTQYNKLFVDVTVCNAARQCRTVPDVLVDTGSTGLRLLRGALDGLDLAPVKDPRGRALSNWSSFGSGDLWGTMHFAQVRVGAIATTRAIPVEVYDLPGRRDKLPDGYANVDARREIARMGNGILGISPHRHHARGYYVKGDKAGAPGASRWVEVRVDAARQLTNPIAYFPAPYDNGSVISLPEVDWTSGANRVQGWLGLGIGAATEALFPHGARVVSHDLDDDGLFPAAIGTRRFDVLVDSGTNALSLDLSHLGVSRHARYASYYDAPAPVPIELAVRSGDDYVRLARPLYVGPTVKYLKERSTHAALPMVVGWDEAPRSLSVLGLPFFYGRTVATGLRGTVNPFPQGAAAVSQLVPDDDEGFEIIDDYVERVSNSSAAPVANDAARQANDDFEFVSKSANGFIAYTD
jgi:hypothetical protein